MAVCGFDAVRTLAEKHPEYIQRLFLNQDRSRFFGPVCKRLASERKLYRLVESDTDLEKLSQSVHHQGVVAMIREPEIPYVDNAIIRNWQRTGERVLLLDRVGNANNLGAIVRSAAFFGISQLVISEDDEQAKITTSAYRVAQGGMEYVDIRQTQSAFILIQDTAGLMVRIGADHRAKNLLADIPHLVDRSKGVLVVLGNEETGLSQDVKKACDHLVCIPGTGDIESLNVAQAATLFLHELSQIPSFL